jgi:hypothetical protein
MTGTEGELLYTVDDLVQKLTGLLTPRQIKRWTAEGLLPSPQRRVPAGATDGVVRALYPWWTVRVIAEVLLEQARGAKLTELRATAGERIDRWRNDPLARPGFAPDLARQFPPAIPRALQRAAWEYAEAYARQFGIDPANVLTLDLYGGKDGIKRVRIGKPGSPEIAQETNQ